MKNNFLLILFLTLLLGTPYTFSQTKDVAAADTVAATSSEQNKEEKSKEEILKELKDIGRDTANRQISVRLNPNFREKYINDEEFDYQRDKGSKSIWEKLKERIYQFLKALFGWDKNINAQKISDMFVNILSGIILLVALFFTVRFFVRHKGNWFLQKANKQLDDIDINDLDELIRRADFDQMIQSAEKKGDTRQCIRMFYLWLLRDLAEKKEIEWYAQKTNSDYYNEIKDESLKQRFSYLSYLYNYIWYGEFKINDAEYRRAKTEFETYLKKGKRHG